MNTRQILLFYFVIVTSGLTLIMLMTFMTAYCNPSKTVLVGINWFNEAEFEFFIIMPIAAISMIMAPVLLYKELKEHA